jgi:hypothetical protein
MIKKKEGSYWAWSFRTPTEFLFVGKLSYLLFIGKCALVPYWVRA